MSETGGIIGSEIDKMRLRIEDPNTGTSTARK
jgi:hypothetical protein